MSLSINPQLFAQARPPRTPTSQVEVPRFTERQREMLNDISRAIDAGGTSNLKPLEFSFGGKVFTVETDRTRGPYRRGVGAGADVSIKWADDPDKVRAWYSSDLNGSSVKARGMSIQDADKILGLAHEAWWTNDKGAQTGARVMEAIYGVP